MAQTNHARPRAEGLIAAWLCLIVAGSATVMFNIVNAWRSGMASPVGVAEGLVPVALAMIVSHLVATSSAGRLLRGITFAVMVGALALSVHATGEVVAPAAGPLWWLYGAVIDTAALVALQVLLTLKVRAAERERERVAAEAAAGDERTALRAELDAAQAALQPLRDALASAGSEREELAAKVEVLTRKRTKTSPRKSPPKKAPASTPKPGGSSTLKSAAISTLETEVPDDVDTQAEALRILAGEPDISGSALGRRLGKSERYGCMLKKSLAGSVQDG